MSDPFVAEIRMFGFDYAPFGWAACDGQLLPISQSTLLFTLVGTLYGGDGMTTFALPNLQGRTPMQPGLGALGVGDLGGQSAVSLQPSHAPPHGHAMRALSSAATLAAPATSAMLADSGAAAPLYSPGATAAVRHQTLASTGGGTPHNNLQPYVALNFCIALWGEYPGRW